MPPLRPRCQLCRQPAAWVAWFADETAAAAPLCDAHQYAATTAVEVGPIRGLMEEPEPLGTLVKRYLELLDRPRFRRTLRPFRAEL